MDLSAMRFSNTTRPAPENRYDFVNGFRKLSAGEKQWRRENSLCIFCAGARHGFHKCPSAKRPKHQLPITGAVLMTTACTHQSVSPEDTESEPEFQ